MKYRAIWAIYHYEMSRAWRTLVQTLVAPVIFTSLYFVVFGAAIGPSMQDIAGVSYAAYIVPGLVMLAVLTQSVANASFGIYFPKFTGSIYELLSAPLSYAEITFGFVSAAASKAIIVALIIMGTARLLVDYQILHPIWMVLFLLLTAFTFSLLGFIIGIWADNFEKLQLVPMIIVMPLTFLGGSFYSIHMLPPFWQAVSLLNPAVYLVNGFRWSFYGSSDINPWLSVAVTGAFMVVFLSVLAWVFRTGYRLRP
ncbi:MAG TPA: ABC transporter permease [Candidatus Paenalcaligenes intestinipullorum]|uniref:Transport permease protein n=1 Tax=Candidatus Paenalcaligenes intestinipullorum TaxID=2838718 RepID=A0A9D2RLG1_9BURK|nr:ABC transporter permease [Candidatus Paenalcaligenes intestinipullorum]